MKTMRWAVLAMLAAGAALGQGLTMDFTALAEKAKSKTEVQLDGAVLEQALVASPELKKLAGLSAVSIHAYEYARTGDYPTSAVDALVRQVESASGWSRILNAREEGEQVHIFLKLAAGKIEGFLLVAAEAKEVAVIRAEGSVELAGLQEVVASAIHYDLESLTKLAGRP